MKLAVLLKKSKVIFLVMLLVYLLGFGGGFIAGKLKWTDTAALRASKISEINRTLEYKVPGYGGLLQNYKSWERQKLFQFILSGRGAKAMLLVFFNNWVVANLTMVVRTLTVVPLLLYPYGRFVQGLTFAQVPASFQMWGTFICEFGGYFLTICGALCALFWMVFSRRFRFSSRREALCGGLKFFAVLYALSGFFILIGSYIETMAMIGMFVR